jgi:UDP:flavonoid glycosyltransferase YjiC (YdhE family)
MTKEKRIYHFCILAPPFLSHLLPMLALAKELQLSGEKVTVACSLDFKTMIEEQGFPFAEIRINLNSNQGSASQSKQEIEEKKRLEDFFSATKKGAIETLSLQMKHRGKDMFANPKEVYFRIKDLNKELNVDFFIIDQLSYSVTVSLLIQKLKFFSFCPPHPASIPQEEAVYGIPLHWPKKLEPDIQQSKDLLETAMKAETNFDAIVNDFLRLIGQSHQTIRRTFSLSSPLAVIYNYPDFDNQDNPQKIFMGSSFAAESLDNKWGKILQRKKEEPVIFISLGTFLAARDDVLRKIILGTRNTFTDCMMIVAAGSSTSSLKDLRNETTIIEEFLPQKAILPYVDLVVHHGGVGTFTETLSFEKPAIVLPFSSDQFNVASDVERQKLGSVLDPNNFSQEELSSDLIKLIDGEFRESISYWSQKIQSAGPKYAVKKMLDLISIDE